MQTISTEKMMDCPRCGGYPGEDEDGKTYTCFLCQDTGYVPYVAPRPWPHGKWQFVQVRETWHYNADCSHMDEWSHPNLLCKTVFNGNRYWDNDEFDVGYTFWCYLNFSKPVTQHFAEKVAYGKFARSCSCEHDCCGHFSGGARKIKRLSRNGKKWIVQVHYCKKWIIQVHYSPNY